MTYNKEQKNNDVSDVSEKAGNGGTLSDHLGDLRRQLIKSIFVFVFFLIFSFATLNWWLPYVTRENDLVVLGPFQVIKLYTSICLTISLGLSLPFLIHFIWQFVKPGLNPKEIRFLGLYAPAMFFLFIVGLAFGYFIVNPLSYQFLIKMGAMNFDVLISASEYVHFLILTTVPLGLLFEMPIIVMFLNSIEVLTANTLRRVRKWSYLVIAIVSALITPPDFISQLIVLAPMALLYELSILLVRQLEAKRDKEINIEG
ncbi:twin-arginine translocase subunit TatC [Bacillus sp. S/N-304-OC-R1]|uniref:twin-arginine translocase subunit TatC n=1 Tax=Bacillus sp. S/N-304-OC-R1 TaxID=2758034 RepID=UPI001C8F01E0|nr:twin-arginine translocase subunit TatC [Bacillus sp. S/N-304-OC-R1]MBY0123044.1 twin-arginine translocase subunit TatC [Bacillus sp. S/N-304-OC-R1]